jgi:branched-chain amino acid transport system permease protein
MLQHLVNGLIQGGIYALIALGYTMVYGILGMINFAHGEIYMIGAYLSIIALAVITTLSPPLAGLPILCLFVALIISVLFASAHGFTVERVAYRRLRDAPVLSALISAIGMSTFLQNYIMVAQGKENKAFPAYFKEPLISHPFIVAGARITMLEIVIIISCILIMLGLHLFISRTKVGRAMRATAQDKKMASLVGIDINKIISLTFIIGSGLAAAGGLMVSMYISTTRFDVGYLAGIKAFTAAVLGGIGNIPGAMLGGFLLGIVETLGIAYISPDYKEVYAFIILMIVLVVRPTGLLGERMAEKT